MTCPRCGRPGRLVHRIIDRADVWFVVHGDTECPVGGVVELWRAWGTLWGGR